MMQSRRMVVPSAASTSWSGCWMAGLTGSASMSEVISESLVSVGILPCKNVVVCQCRWRWRRDGHPARPKRSNKPARIIRSVRLFFRDNSQCYCAWQRVYVLPNARICLLSLPVIFKFTCDNSEFFFLLINKWWNNDKDLLKFHFNSFIIYSQTF